MKNALLKSKSIAYANPLIAATQPGQILFVFPLIFTYLIFLSGNSHSQITQVAILTHLGNHHRVHLQPLTWHAQHDQVADKCPPIPFSLVSHSTKEDVFHLLQWFFSYKSGTGNRRPPYVTTVALASVLLYLNDTT